MIVSELQYFPPITFFTALYKETYLYLDIYEIYRKMSFRNRCMVAGAQGIISLSIPLKEGRNQQLPVNEVLISDSENWQARHLKSLRSAYNRSPFFEYYEEELASMYGRRATMLWEWNLGCLKWVNAKLNRQVEIRCTESVIPFKSPGIDDQRNAVIPKNYTQWNPVRYRQVFEERTGFFPNLSILDLLFNAGPRAGELIQNQI